nr:apelin [Anser cygnoides]
MQAAGSPVFIDFVRGNFTGLKYDGERLSSYTHRLPRDPRMHPIGSPGLVPAAGALSPQPPGPSRLPGASRGWAGGEPGSRAGESGPCRALGSGRAPCRWPGRPGAGSTRLANGFCRGQFRKRCRPALPALGRAPQHPHPSCRLGRGGGHRANALLAVPGPVPDGTGPEQGRIRTLVRPRGARRGAGQRAGGWRRLRRPRPRLSHKGPMPF